MSDRECTICGRRLNVVGDELSGDCGGDCWGCIGKIEADMGHGPSLAKVMDEWRRGLRLDWAPNREGWMTGELADAPARPPFPQLTDFERLALESVAALFGDRADAFLAQVACAEAVDRINTSVGFYTRVKVDPTKCQPVPFRQQCGYFEVENVEHGLAIVLWDTDGDGYLGTIEGWTVDENPLANVDLAKLKFIRQLD